MKSPRAPPAYGLAKLAAAQAKIWLEEGKEQEALELILALGQFGGDLSRHAPFSLQATATGVLTEFFEVLRSAIVEGRFMKIHLGDLDRGLEVLDNSYPE